MEHMAFQGGDKLGVSAESKKQVAPPATRNSEPIAAVLQEHLPRDRPLNILEVASGTGQHVVYMAQRMPWTVWTPTDVMQDKRESILAYVQEAGLPNVRHPVALDARSPDSWPPGPYDAILNVNMIHISEPAAMQGLVKGAGKVLSDGGWLIFYGPFKIHGEIFPESNVEFDASLRSRNPEWGLRDIDDVSGLCGAESLALKHQIAMPANNWMLLFQKAAGAAPAAV